MAPVSPEPSIGEALRAAMNAARRAQDKDRTLVLGKILANLKNREIELRRPPTDDDVVEVLRKGIKTRRESIEQYTSANRPELAGAERAQIKVLEASTLRAGLEALAARRADFDTVILSPGAPSYGQLETSGVAFKDFEERGRAFIRIATELFG